MTNKGNQSLPEVKKTIYSLIIKRLLDLVLSGLAIIILSPVFLVVAILELIIHGRPIVFAQKRPGLHGKIFNIYKFRSMTNETAANGELLPGNERLTKFGKFIRKYSIDELPELICIFTGKMSIIGPRPLRVEYLPLYSSRHMMRHEVRPGFACVRLRPGKTWTWNEQFENDIFYVENVSFLLDVAMLFAVAREAVHPSKYRIEATRKPFNGTNLNE